MRNCRGGNARLHQVRTPFLSENPHDGPAGNLCGADPTATCPWCSHKLPYAPERPSGSRATGDAKHVVDTKGTPAVGGRVDDTTSQDRGALQPIAAKVLMKILYAARMARFDLLRAVCHLACFITKWTTECDKRLHRLVCYIHSTKSHRMVGWVGDALKDVDLHLYADADFAGCTDTQRSTSGCHLQMRGKHTCFPLAGISKHQSLSLIHI